VRKAAKVATWRRVDDRRSHRPGSAPTRWPQLDEGFGFEVPLLAGDHVTDDAGTGFVHTAPGHGADDYLRLEGGMRSSRSPTPSIPTAPIIPHVPLFAGLKVLETEGKKAGKFGPPTARSWTS
jgi:isoleucyl-tRNA synthetase